MKPLHTAAALLIAAIWGLNFTVIRFGLDEFTPFAFSTWRFLLCALPSCSCRSRRSRGRRWPASASSCSRGQFIFLFFAMQAGLPPGLTSGAGPVAGAADRWCWPRCSCASARRADNGSALRVSMAGVVLIARSVEGTPSVLAVGLALMSALTWAFGNLVFLRGARRVDVRRHRVGERPAADSHSALASLARGGPAARSRRSWRRPGLAGSCCSTRSFR